MRRLFVLSAGVLQDRIVISEKNRLHHLKDVLRLMVGDTVRAFDEKGREFECVVSDVSQTVTLRIEKKSQSRRLPRPDICVFCAIPKGSRMDEAVDMLTQVGVEEIVPLLTERVIVKLDERAQAMKVKRWEKVVLAALQQSTGAHLTRVRSPMRMRQALLHAAGYDLKLIPTLAEASAGIRRQKLKDALAGRRPDRIAVFIGPEGDFTEEEVALAVEAGCIPVTLGDSVLRVETAAMAVSAFLRLYFHEDR